jgi:hypothetical protein
MIQKCRWNYVIWYFTGGSWGIQSMPDTAEELV